MELSLQKKVNRMTVAKEREAFIQAYKFRIGQKLSYKQFKDLYRRYSDRYSEEDFAKYFLDIEYSKLAAMRKGSGQENTFILTQELITEEEISRYRRAVVGFYDLTPNSKIYYENFEEMYKNCGGRLSPRIFAEEVLGIWYDSILSSRTAKDEKSRYKYYDSSKIASRKMIASIREKILADRNLHIGDPINLELFNYLYKNYGFKISEKEFSERVLEMPIGSLSKLKTNTIEESRLFANHVVDPEDLYTLREKVILENNLQIGQPLMANQFEDLFQKYGGILSREIFGDEILGIGADSVKKLSRSGEYSFILNDIEIPEEYILDLKKKIVQENPVSQYTPIDYETLQAFHKKYSYILTEGKFANMVLEVEGQSYTDLRAKKRGKVLIFKNYEHTDISALRRKVIEEEGLHYSDKLEYSQISALHKKYAPNMRESKFALEILDVETKKLNSMKFSKKVFATKILLNEPLPTEQELEELKWRIIEECKLHTKDTITYSRLQDLHKKYGGILPEAMFALKILDIGQTGYNNVKGEFQPEVVVLLKTKMPDDKFEELRSNVLEDNDIYPGRPITLNDFERLYRGYIHCMSKIDFSKRVLGINYDSYNLLATKSRKSVGALAEKRKALSKTPIVFTDEQVEELKGYLVQGLSREQIASRLRVSLNTLDKNFAALEKSKKIPQEEIQYRKVLNLYLDGYSINQIVEITGYDITTVKQYYSQARKEANELDIDIDHPKCDMTPGTIRKRARAAIKKYDFTSRGIRNVQTYISSVKERFNQNPTTVKKEELEDLDQSIVFIQGGLEEILLFSKICVFMQEYNRARSVIAFNIDNEGITFEEQDRLMRLSKGMGYAMRRVSALDMLTKGIDDMELISRKTGISEIDVIRMQRRLNEGSEAPIAPEEIFDSRMFIAEQELLRA